MHADIDDVRERILVNNIKVGTWNIITALLCYDCKQNTYTQYSQIYDIIIV